MGMDSLSIPPWCGGWDIARYRESDHEKRDAEATTANGEVFPPSGGKDICQTLGIGPESHGGKNDMDK